MATTGRTRAETAAAPDHNALAHARGRDHAGAFGGNESGDM